MLTQLAQAAIIGLLVGQCHRLANARPQRGRSRIKLDGLLPARAGGGKAGHRLQCFAQARHVLNRSQDTEALKQIRAHLYNRAAPNNDRA